MCRYLRKVKLVEELLPWLARVPLLRCQWPIGELVRGRTKLANIRDAFGYYDAQLHHITSYLFTSSQLPSGFRHAVPYALCCFPPTIMVC